MINNKKIKMLMLFLTSAILLGGCGSASEEKDDMAYSQIAEFTLESNVEENNIEENDIEGGNLEDSNIEEASNDTLGIPAAGDSELLVTFGEGGEAFTMYLYEDNETAETIAGYVGSSGWRLPIYEYDDEVNYDVMQYYDISSSYEIPSNPQTVTSVKAGEVYYSDPNRVILFYGDAEVSQEYTPIGYFEPTEEFLAAVRDNPTLEGWGNKIIQIEQP